MLSQFICPDGEMQGIDQCYAKCRMPYRCATIPYLHLAASEREWKGEGSTTQLLNGTMYSFLKITMPYAITPDSMAFAIHGTKSHTQLEIMAKELGLPSEISATDDGRNAIDLIEIEEGIVSLIDTKTWGSYKVAKALGIVEGRKVPDPSGAVYKSSGKWGKAGTFKMVSEFKRDPTQAENHEAGLQLNRYRIMIEDTGLHIDRMQVFAIVRDGGIAMAVSRGVTQNTYLIEVERLDDDYVRDYFQTKNDELKQAVSTGGWGEPCNDVECWGGSKCERFCPVNMYCPKGMFVGGR